MKFESEAEIEKIIGEFEAAILPSDSWHHREHLLMAMHYSLADDLDSALAKMRAGINKLNDFQGVVTTPERGYHETLTVLWCSVVFDFVKANEGLSSLDMVNGLIVKFAPNYSLEFYSKELLFSREARFGFVEPDLKPLPCNFNS